MRLFSLSILPSSDKDVAESKSRRRRTTSKCLSLMEVIQLGDNNAIDHVKLDKRSGRGWIFLQQQSYPPSMARSYAFHFPPGESLTVMTKIKNSDKDITVEFVDRMDLFGDLRSIAPKAVIGLGLMIAMRASMIGIANALDSHNMTVARPKTPVARPPERVQNSWARSRLRPTPPSINKGGMNQLVTFRDVAGLNEAKRELGELVHFLKDPNKYHAMGARIPRGALLSGPPGTGKTLLAKAVAGEAEVPFFSLSGSDFMEVYVGVGASRVRELFNEARKSTTGAILFIDEVDAIGRKRSSHLGNGASDERENTLNQLLIEMDGFSANENVVVIAASNRCDTLDDALTRPGRFDRTIECELPSVKDRQSILSCHLEAVKLDVSGDGKLVRPFDDYEGMLSKMDAQELSVREGWCARIAALTPGFSGADLSNLVNEAAILAARESRNGVLLSDLEEAVERTAFGLEKGGELPAKDRLKKTAYHEAGHAIIGWMLPHSQPPIKLSIVPRKSGVLGYAQQIPNDEMLDTADSIRDKLAVLMGGRIAEEIVFGQGSTGAEDDLQKATILARNYVCSWGFAPSEAGLMSIQNRHYGELNISERTRTRMDQAVQKLLDEAQVRAREVIHEHQGAFKALAEALYSKESMNYKDLLDTIGVEPVGKLSEQFKHYLKHELAEVVIEPVVPSSRERKGVELDKLPDHDTKGTVERDL